MLKASCVKRLEVMKFISEGSFGHVFRALRNDGTRAVIKVRLGEAVAEKNEGRGQIKVHLGLVWPKQRVSYSMFKVKNRLRKSAHERLNDLEYDDDDIEYHPRGHLVHIIVMEEIAGVIGAGYIPKVKRTARTAYVQYFLSIGFFQKAQTDTCRSTLVELGVRVHRRVEETSEADAD
ncbi:unnamed protein product [Pylaiella littoralis]